MCVPVNEILIMETLYSILSMLGKSLLTYILCMKILINLRQLDLREIDKWLDEQTDKQTNITHKDYLNTTFQIHVLGSLIKIHRFV